MNQMSNSAQFSDLSFHCVKALNDKLAHPTDLSNFIFISYREYRPVAISQNFFQNRFMKRQQVIHSVNEIFYGANEVNWHVWFSSTIGVPYIKFVYRTYRNFMLAYMLKGANKVLTRVATRRASRIIKFAHRIHNIIFELGYKCFQSIKFPPEIQLNHLDVTTMLSVIKFLTMDNSKNSGHDRNKPGDERLKIVNYVAPGITTRAVFELWRLSKNRWKETRHTNYDQDKRQYALAVFGFHNSPHKKLLDKYSKYLIDQQPVNVSVAA